MDRLADLNFVAHTDRREALAEHVTTDAAGLVDATRRRLGFTSGEVVPLSYSGGIFAMPEILDSFPQLSPPKSGPPS